MSRVVFNRGSSGVGNPEVNDGERRHADAIKRGVVTEARYTNPPAVRVRIGDEDDEDGHYVTGWLPMPGSRAQGDRESHPLEVGEGVLVFSEGGELQNGVVMPAGLFNDDVATPSTGAGHWRKEFSDGGVIEYNRGTGEFLIEGIAKVTAKVGESSVVVDTESVTASIGDGSIVVRSDSVTLAVGGIEIVISSGGVAITGGTVTHDGVNIGKTHVHGGVQTGSGNSLVPH